MSTRCNVILKESYSYKANNGRTVNRTKELVYYRHSDGYPEGTLPSLNKFLELLRENKIRRDLSQGAGWLILIGAIEYNTIPEYEKGAEGKTEYGLIDTIKEPKSWKVGAYEPTTEIHGDIEFLYEINMRTAELTIKRRVFGETEKLDSWEIIEL